MPAKRKSPDYTPLKNPRSDVSSNESRTEVSPGRSSAGYADEPDSESSFSKWRISSSAVSDSNDSAVFRSARTSKQASSDVDVRDTSRNGDTDIRSSATEVQTNGRKEAQLRQDHWILKRGHAISFAGLYLFTVVLYFRPYELFPSLMWLSSIAFWIATVTLIVFIPTQIGLEGRLTIRTREVSFVLLLVVAALLSVPFALDKSVALGSFTEYLKVVVMFIVMVNVVRTERRLRALLLLALAASCFLSIGALYDFRLGNLGVEGRRISGVIGGIFSNPNDLALHLVTMVPIAIGLMFSSRNVLKKVAYLLCGIMLVTGIVVTLSRSGFLAFACSIFFLTWKLAPRGRIVFAVLGLLAIVTIVGIAPSAFRSRIATTEDESALARTDDLKRSLFIMVHHPLLGVGMGNYVIYSNRAKATHNAYTQVGAELGIPAAIIYFLFVIAPLKRLRKIELENVSSKKKPRLYYLAIALQASLIGYMVASFFASVAFLWYIYYLTAYAVCLQRIYETAKAAPSKTLNV